jgi:hypothetical protein
LTGLIRGEIDFVHVLKDGGERDTGRQDRVTVRILVPVADPAVLSLLPWCLGTLTSLTLGWIHYSDRSRFRSPAPGLNPSRPGKPSFQRSRLGTVVVPLRGALKDVRG